MNQEQLRILVDRYVRSITNPINKEYDTGYIDGVVDTVGDIITFFGYKDLEPFADVMEELQRRIHDGEVFK